jgi:phosphoribosylamine-glycine ligase
VRFALHLRAVFLRFVQVFHAGTARNAGGELVSAGGRVLNVTALGKNVAEAQANAYKVSVCAKLNLFNFYATSRRSAHLLWHLKTF